jgi:uncharacterized membrane protein YqjE
MSTTQDIGTTGATDTGAGEQAKHVASTAADQTQQVAGTAQEEIAKVAGEARAQAQDLVGEARTQAAQVLGEQAGTQRDRVVSTLSGLSSDLRSMADGAQDSGLAATLAREAADRARTLEQHLDGRDPAALLDDVRRFARQRPGLFLAGALVAGIAAGRLTRGAQAAQSEGTTGTASPGGGTTGTGAPSAGGRGQPPRDPAGTGGTGLMSTTTPGGHVSGTGTDAGAGAGTVPPPRGANDERSLGEIVQALTQDTTTLLKTELELAKVELKEEAVRAGKGAGMLGGAGLAGYLVLLFLSFALMFGLDTVLPLWASALVTAGVWALVAGVLAIRGRSELKHANPQLPRTQQTLKEDAQWARAQKS